MEDDGDPFVYALASDAVQVQRAPGVLAVDICYVAEKGACVHVEPISETAK